MLAESRQDVLLYVRHGNEQYTACWHGLNNSLPGWGSHMSCASVQGISHTVLFASSQGHHFPYAGEVKGESCNTACSFLSQNGSFFGTVYCPSACSNILLLLGGVFSEGLGSLATTRFQCCSFQYHCGSCWVGFLLSYQLMLHEAGFLKWLEQSLALSCWWCSSHGAKH